MATPSGSGTLHAFVFRDYRLFWTARLCSTFGQTCMVVAIGWQVYETARLSMDAKASSFQLGLVGFMQFLPLFLLVLVTGWTADRVDRRVIVRLTTALLLVGAMTLAAVSVEPVPSLPAIFGIAMLLGVARAFSQPASNALGPNLVPPEVLPSAIATNSIAGRLGAIAGPAAGGFLFAWSPAAPYLFSAGLFLGSLFCLLFVTSGAPTPTPTTARRQPWRQVIEGLRFVRGHPLVLGAISLDLCAVLLGGATALLPAYARDVLHVGSVGLGVLRAAPAAGAIASAVWFALRPLRHRIGVKMLWSVAAYGLATIGFGASRSMSLSIGCLFVLGAADMLSVYVRQSLIQLSTPDEMRGRVGAVSSLFVSASNELGEAESGFLAALVGPVAAVIGGGMGAIAVTAVWARWFPALRLARGFDAQQTEGGARPLLRLP